MKGTVDLNRRQKVHVVGVCGPGMSAVALALAQMGHDVSGSDIREGPVTKRLRRAGVRVSIGHDDSLVDGCNVVTASPAIPLDNPEVCAARDLLGVFIPRSAMLASICRVAPTIAVAGTHGKTTTTSLLVHIFDEAGLHPNFIVGGEIKELDTNARWTGGPLTIVEADESDGTHLELPLDGTILTNVDVDHLDHYGDFAGIADAFSRYLQGVGGPKIVCLDDPWIAEMLSQEEGDFSFVSYGASPTADFHYCDIRSENGTTHFTVEHDNESVEVETMLRGTHNVSNITAAIAMVTRYGVELSVAAAAVRSFRGVGRRFDVRAEVDGFTLVDDYAHLPREIDAVLTAARTSGDGWRRIIAVFQPNRFNRMSEISSDYADAFRSADLVVVTDIYSSGTSRIEGVTGHLVVDAILSKHPHAEVVWVQSREDLAKRVSDLLESGDVCISMGCGDIEHLPREILELRHSVGES